MAAPLQLVVGDIMPQTAGNFLRQEAGLSAHMVKRLKGVPDGLCCNGKPIRVVDIVQTGDVLTLHFPETCDLEQNPSLPVRVVYETAQVLVCEKPADMPTHPSMLHRNDTLANWYAAMYPDFGFHVLNRLDRNTSGLCLIAKTAFAAHALQGKVEKTYFALVPKGLRGSGTVDAPIARVEASVINRCVRADGKPARTHYTVLREASHCSLLAFTLETGRTHQIRVHMAYLGYPLLGDDLYGGDCSQLKAHALHCGALQFSDPLTGDPIILQIPLRAEMQTLLEE